VLDFQPYSTRNEVPLAPPKAVLITLEEQLQLVDGRINKNYRARRRLFQETLANCHDDGMAHPVSDKLNDLELEGEQLFAQKRLLLSALPYTR
jgi:hypothetical protein